MPHTSRLESFLKPNSGAKGRGRQCSGGAGAVEQARGAGETSASERADRKNPTTRQGSLALRSPLSALRSLSGSRSVYGMALKAES